MSEAWEKAKEQEAKARVTEADAALEQAKKAPAATERVTKYSLVSTYSFIWAVGLLLLLGYITFTVRACNDSDNNATVEIERINKAQEYSEFRP
jgi:hypothetical protein